MALEGWDTLRLRVGQAVVAQKVIRLGRLELLGKGLPVVTLLVLSRLPVEVEVEVLEKQEAQTATGKVEMGYHLQSQGPQ